MDHFEKDFLVTYQKSDYHTFRELERYALLLEKMRAEADRKLTF